MARLSPMVRAALFVRDLEASTRFYRDLLGLEECWYEGDLSDGNAHALLGMPAGTAVRARILKAPGPAWGMVGLFELNDPRPLAVARDASRANLGESCLVFYCADLDPVVEQLETAGYPVLCPPLVLRLAGQDRQREMCCRDPDGIMINLIEWDPDEPKRPEQR